jgi:hypothetical protein
VLVKPSANTAVGLVASERGAVAILFAILTPAFLFLFLLVVDVGNWYVHKRHLQMQVDAAALAGGAYFGDCFSADPSVAAAADASIKNAATQYVGGASSTFNSQVGGGSSRIATLYNSKTFAVGGPPADDTETSGPCETPSLMFDVKNTERDVPFVFGALVGAFVPSAKTTIDAINARARVELKKETIVKGSLPLAIPDVNPRAVAVTFVNEATGAKVAGPFGLTKGAAAGGMNIWAKTLPAFTLPAAGANGVRIGMRVSVGGASGDCTGVAKGVGFVCYDNTATGTGLVAIRDYPATTGTLTAPVIQAVWAVSRASCSFTNPSPLFSEITLAGATSCPMDVYARVSAGAGFASGTLKATINGVTRTLVPPSTPGGDWTTPAAQPFTIPAAGGPYDVDLNWTCPSGCGSKGISFNSVQRVYAANDANGAGVVKWVDVSEAGTRIYSATPGSHAFTVSIGVAPSLDLSTSAQNTLLRFTDNSGGRTTAIDCDGSGASKWVAALTNGCQTPYQLNSAGVCPDPSPPAGPADCVPLETGKMANSASSALNARFASCPANNWPGPIADGDPRVVKLMITDFSALDGSGKTSVPVTNFAAFYITGWQSDKATCSNNQAWPFPGTPDKGDVWGHFMKYVEPDPDATGEAGCPPPPAITPCTPVLVK